MLQVTQFTYAQLKRLQMTKGECFASLKDQGVEFDYAIPEDWADEFYAFCQKHNPVVTYHLITSTTVWTYGTIFGNPLSCCAEVTELLEKYYA